MFTTSAAEHFEVSNRDKSADRSELLDETELIERYRLNECVKWIGENKYERTCLQFPNDMLDVGTSIALYLQRVLDRVVYILGDTAYGSCCVDEVAAQHVKGDSLIHFGHACLSPVMNLPVFYVFSKCDLDVENLCKTLKGFSEGRQVVVFYDDVYHHKHSELCSSLDGKNIEISKLAVETSAFDVTGSERILCGRIFSTASSGSDVSAVYLGEETVTLENLVLSLPDFKWYRYKVDSGELVEYQLNRNKFLMRRAHLVEKIREANVIGILIGTLGIKNYLSAIERIKILAKKNKKKCYKLAVGKPNVAKLANFPEIDVFVCISCQENALLKDFKGYYKPIVSLIEIEMALGERPYSVEYTSDFRELLPGGSFHREIDLSLDETTNSTETCQDLLERSAGTVVESPGAQFLTNRSWRGLEQKLGETEVRKAETGRAGIPQSYANELTTVSNEKS